MSGDQGDGGGFRVRDRRRFSESGEPREETSASTEPTTPPPSDPTGTLPGVTFSSFVLGLSTQALMHLGEVPDPTTGQAGRDLEAAKQLIDILALLQTKTTGNLDDDERGLIDGVLYDLRMRYVDLARQADDPKETP